MDRELYVLNLYLFFKIVIFIFRELFVGKKFYFISPIFLSVFPSTDECFYK